MPKISKDIDGAMRPAPAQRNLKDVTSPAHNRGQTRHAGVAQAARATAAISAWSIARPTAPSSAE